MRLVSPTRTSTFFHTSFTIVVHSRTEQGFISCYTCAFSPQGLCHSCVPRARQRRAIFRRVPMVECDVERFTVSARCSILSPTRCASSQVFAWGTFVPEENTAEMSLNTRQNSDTRRFVLASDGRILIQNLFIALKGFAQSLAPDRVGFLMTAALVCHSRDMAAGLRSMVYHFLFLYLWSDSGAGPRGFETCASMSLGRWSVPNGYNTSFERFSVKQFLMLLGTLGGRSH